MRDKKVTFRASDELVERVDEIDESRSEIMRDALRSYLDKTGATNSTEDSRSVGSFDRLMESMVESVVERKLTEVGQPGGQSLDLTLNIPEGVSGGGSHEGVVSGENTVRHRSDEGTGDSNDGSMSGTSFRSCRQCGEELEDDHVYCPNCGSKEEMSICECGGELRSGWEFCPTCGRRTPDGQSVENG
ncbi:MAG: zinc-ribbon domain-containing protein [Halobacteria archaeon]